MPGLDRDFTLRVLAETSDINFYGNVHGGAVMKWIDQTAYACAVGWCGRYAVTVYVGGIRFYKPIHIGDIVELDAKLIFTGRTSMHIAVDVRAYDPRGGEESRRHTTHCIVVFVAIDENGDPVPVPPWEPTTEADIALRDYAVKLMGLRKGIEDQMAPFRVSE